MQIKEYLDKNFFPIYKNFIYYLEKPYSNHLERTNNRLEGYFRTTLPKKNERYVSLQNDEDLETVVSFICDAMSYDWKKVNLLLPYSIDINGFKKENYCLSIIEIISIKAAISIAQCRA